MSLQSFAPELCSLICQDPILERRDLNSICFISQTFRKEAQRILDYRFPCLRGATRVKSWCLALKRTPHLALNVKDLVLFLPKEESFHADDITHLIRALRMCVNLKGLSVLPESPRRSHPSYAKFAYMLVDLPFTLTKFVNGYFDQRPSPSDFARFLNSQNKLETLKMHSDAVPDYQYVFPPYLSTLACSPLWHHGTGEWLRLRLDFENSVFHEIDMLKCIPRCHAKSLAIFLKKKPNRKQCHLGQVIGHFAQIRTLAFVRRLEIHQFLPIVEERCLLFAYQDDFPTIETLVLRPPPRLPRKSGDDPNLCAYVNLRTRDGRRKTVKNIMETFEALTRLVLIVQDHDYEFRRDLQTGIITKEELITLDKQEWALVY